MSENTEDSAIQGTELQNIDQIREIILGPQMRNIGDLMFGSQLRELDKKLSKLEERITDEANTLRSETSSRLDSLESYIKLEIENAVETIAIERREREEDVQRFQYELSKYANDADKKVKQTEAKLDQNKSDSRNALLEQSKTLLSEVQSVRVSLTDTINKTNKVLQSEKTDRLMLADIFNEVSVRLHGELRSLPTERE